MQLIKNWGVRTKLLCRKKICAKSKPDPKSQYISWSCRGLGRRALWIMQDYNITDSIEIPLLTQPCTYEMVSSSFSAKSQLKVMSKTRASLTIMPSTERKNIEKCLRCSWQFLPYLSLFFFSQRSMSLSEGQFLQLSASESPNLTPMMTSVWLSHKPRMRTSPLVSNPPLP